MSMAETRLGRHAWIPVLTVGVILLVQALDPTIGLSVEVLSHLGMAGVKLAPGVLLSVPTT